MRFQAAYTGVAKCVLTVVTATARYARGLLQQFCRELHMVNVLLKSTLLCSCGCRGFKLPIVLTKVTL